MTVGGYQKAADLPNVIPVFPLKGVLLLPGAELPLNIFEPRYLNMLDDAMSGRRLIGMVQPFGGDGLKPALAPIGCAGRITAYSETGDGRYLITLTGVCRFKILGEAPALTPYRQAVCDFATFEADLAAIPDQVEADRKAFLEALRVYLMRRGLSLDWATAREAPVDALVSSLSMALPFSPAEKQALLEAPDGQDRYETLMAMLTIDAAQSDDDDPPAVQ